MTTISKPIKEFIQNADWYHTIEFKKNLISNGVYDHRPYLKYYGFPKSLKHQTVLDVGSADGFFSFEFEKRGAKSILAIDTHQFDGSVGHTDISPTKIFNYIKKYKKYKKEKKLYSNILKQLKINKPIRILIAKKLLNSNINFKVDSVYNLEIWNQKFDLVFCGDLIEHLKNPLGALENLCSVTRKLCIISLSNCLKTSIWMKLSLTKNNSYLEYHGNKAGGSFFHIYPKTFKQMCLASGFKKVKIYSFFYLKNKKTGRRIPHAVFHCFV